MKILRLQTSNVKRLHAVEITPEGNLITVGGKNGAGKSSVLDSIAYALGGKELVPAEPIRKGETEAKIVVDLGDYIVTRRFKREHLDCNCGGTDAGSHEPSCASRLFGPTSSTLIVTNKDGAKYPSPQAVLDKLLGKLTFDPLQFAHATAKEQNIILRALTNTDVSPLESLRRTSVDERTMLKRTLSVVAHDLERLPPVHANVPAEELPLTEVSRELQRAEELRRVVHDAETTLVNLKIKREQATEALGRHVDVIAELERRLVTARTQQREAEKLVTSVDEKITAQIGVVKAAQEAVPDATALQARLAELEDVNKKVRANDNRATLQKRHDSLEAQVQKLTNTINDVDRRKEEILKNAHYPVEGLGLSDDGVTFGGIPFEQASTSEQIRVSVAIGLALNPTLRVLLIRNGNALDDDSLKAVADQAADADAQIWIEYVTHNDEGVSVMIEDGHLA